MGKTRIDRSMEGQPRFEVIVVGDLPYYVPMPASVILKPSQIGVEPFELSFIHYKPLRHPDCAQGEGIDDRIGTFIRSRCHILFPLMKLPEGDYPELYAKKALTISNNAIRAIRYRTHEPAMRHVSHFENCVIQTNKIMPDGKTSAIDTITQKTDFRPFGIQLRRILNEQTLNDVWLLFNGLEPIQSAQILLLDAKYHKATGDITRACLDLAVALEINFDGLIEYYSFTNPNLVEIDMEEKNIFWKYDEGLLQATGHSLHEIPDYYANLEYIYGIRNSIAHSWKTEFKLTDRMKRKSRYLEHLNFREGHVINSSEEVDELIHATEKIINFTYEVFYERMNGVSDI